MYFLIGFTTIVHSQRKNSMQSVKRTVVHDNHHVVEDDLLSNPSLLGTSYGTYGYSFSSNDPFLSDPSKALMNPVVGFPPRMSPPSVGGIPYGGKMLEISENKKLNEFSAYCNHVVELVCTQSGSKSLQVGSKRGWRVDIPELLHVRDSSWDCDWSDPQRDWIDRL